MGIAIGAKHASVVWRVSVARRVRYGRFHCITIIVINLGHSLKVRQFKLVKATHISFRVHDLLGQYNIMI